MKVKIKLPELNRNQKRISLQLASLITIAVGLGLAWLPLGVIALGLVGLNFSLGEVAEPEVKS